jgi:hypothetical protein
MDVDKDEEDAAIEGLPREQDADEDGKIRVCCSSTKQL